MNTFKGMPVPIQNDLQEAIVDDEEITAKIPLSTFAQINNGIADVPFANSKIILLQAKPEYQHYYTAAIYGVILRSETPTNWLGVPTKNPAVGLMRWEKKSWNKVYGFNLNITMTEE